MKHKAKKKTGEGSWTWKDSLGTFFQVQHLLLKVLLVFFWGFLVLGAGVGLGYAASLFQSAQVPPGEELAQQVTRVAGQSELRYADGSLIDKVDSDLLRTPVTLDQVSTFVQDAVIATEDENFYEHDGIVPKAVIRATLGSVVGFGSSSGGSTLTQQLIKQQVVGDAPTFSRKAAEILDALALEETMSKEDILLAYLNIAPFGRNYKGQNIAGIEEAAQGIFGKSAADLNLPQSAFIAGLPQSPIVYSPYAADGTLKTEENQALGLERQKNVLYNMYRTGKITEDEYQEALEYNLQADFRPGEPTEGETHHYLYHTALAEAQDALYTYLIKRDQVSERDLKNESTVEAYQKLAQQELSNGGYVVKTTINKAVHEAMQSAAANFGGMLDDGTGRVEMGNVLQDNQTGAVLGFVGGRDYESNQNNHAFDTVRSPGSTIKPLLPYGIAIDQGIMGSASIVSNYPTNYSSGQPIMHVNSRGTGMMTFQEALNQSVNIPAYWTYRILREQGIDVQDYMEKMNYEIADYNIESLPLGGGIEVSVDRHTNGYQTLANNGQYIERYMVASIETQDGQVVYEHQTEPVQVFSAATATIMQDMMRGVLDSGTTTTFKSRLQGINPALAGADWIGKTGTTNDYGDAWLMVATPGATLGGWTGHDDNSSMSNLSGYNNNANYMANLVNAIHQADPDVWKTGQRFSLDPSVIQSSVLRATGQLPGSGMSGSTVTSNWAVNGAPVTSENFMVGGSDADKRSAWNSVRGGGTPSSSNSR
ncbi:penicillin-binding protein PBP1B [Streptococcus sp. NLN64]|uniref:penicillin-binding protein PBP1B n=1 Tax=Streptococcus sp. NLN64 TaxID=2822799 RepID=UPI0018C9B606|nr:penicillin-binding protein [Streptococcus sp. NLN64]